MSWIVEDASVTLSWCFPDEQTPSAMGVLDLLRAGEQALVPAFWCSEVLNSWLVGELSASAKVSSGALLLPKHLLPAVTQEAVESSPCNHCLECSLPTSHNSALHSPF